MNRYIGKLPDANTLPKTEDGFTCCRWCMKAVHPPRRTLCSKECTHELNLRTNGKYLRECVYKRDNAICALCNTDTKKIAKMALSLVGSDREIYLKSYNISLKRNIYVKKFGGSLWDADHIIPVKDGGGCSSLENMRTLCIPCHKIITAQSGTRKKIILE
jgi:5-methylcytosine-specific restriction protein A